MNQAAQVYWKEYWKDNDQDQPQSVSQLVHGNLGLILITSHSW